MDRVYWLGDEGQFFLQELREEDLGEAVALCDRCVGENMYQHEALAEAITLPDHCFFLLKTAEGKNAGYIYYYLTDMESIAAHAKLSMSPFKTVYPRKNAPVGKIQSVGLLEEYRKRGLAARMIRFALECLRKRSIEMAYIICWKIDGVVSLASALRECGFSHLAEAKRVWYDMMDLVCPVCGGRCECDAEVYYKRLNQEVYE